MSTNKQHHVTVIVVPEDDNVTTVESVNRVVNSDDRDGNGFNDKLMNLIFSQHFLCGDGSKVNPSDSARTLVMNHMRHVADSDCGYGLPIQKLDTLYAIIDNNTIVRDKNGDWVNTYSHYFDRKTNAVIVIDPLLCDDTRYTVVDIYIPYGHDGATKMNCVVKHLQLRASPII